MAINFTWRVTKYNPKYRDNRGKYLRKEWTSISDIGNIIGDGDICVTIQDYISTEDKYVRAILDIMNCLDIQKLNIFGLEKWEDMIDISDFPALYNDKMIKLYSEISDGVCLEKEQISDLCRMILREKIWCKLKYDSKMYVHFGHDYYMFIGSEKRCQNIISNIEKFGLYVEDFISPINDEN